MVFPIRVFTEICVCIRRGGCLAASLMRRSSTEDFNFSQQRFVAFSVQVSCSLCQFFFFFDAENTNQKILSGLPLDPFPEADTTDPQPPAPCRFRVFLKTSVGGFAGDLGPFNNVVFV